MERGKSKGMLVNQIARLESALQERDIIIAGLRKEIAELKATKKEKKDADKEKVNG